MEFREYLRVLRRRWVFAVSCVCLGLIAATLVALLTPRTYTAKAELFVATADQNSSNAYQDGLFTQQRVKSYAQIVTGPSVLRGVISNLNLNMTPAQLAPKISSVVPLDTVLVDIQVKDGSPQKAQAIANATATQFIKFVSGIEPSPSGTPLVRVSVVGPSAPPASPTSPRIALDLGIGLLSGVVIGVGGALLRDRFDTSIRAEEEVPRDFGVPVLAVIPRERRRRQTMLLPAAPGSRRAEAFGDARTRLGFADQGRMPRSVLVTSADRPEDKTSTAVDLAASLGRAGQRVILVEADLRRPSLAKWLGRPGAPGLSSVLTHEVRLSDALLDWEDGVTRILPGGPAVCNPSELLCSDEMGVLLRTLEGQADVVIIDSPPTLPYTDSSVLATKVNAVLLVVSAERTRHEVVGRALDKLRAVDARIAGVVLAGVDSGRATGAYVMSSVADAAPFPRITADLPD